MPKELRKRGKKHKKSKQEEQPPANAPVDEHEKPSEGPSWIISAHKTEDVNPEAPFGYVDPDIKAYFRTVDDQIRAWQEDEHIPEEENVDMDPNEGKRSCSQARRSCSHGRFGSKKAIFRRRAE